VIVELFCLSCITLERGIFALVQHFISCLLCLSSKAGCGNSQRRHGGLSVDFTDNLLYPGIVVHIGYVCCFFIRAEADCS
jgi:hypothetical protein